MVSTFLRNGGSVTFEDLENRRKLLLYEMVENLPKKKTIF